MSGGYWNYSNDTFAHDVFGWQFSPDYGEDGHKQSKMAAQVNPLEDRQISEMLWDMLCLLHSYDWYKEGDTDEDCYREDVAWFKDKWLTPSKHQIDKRTVQDACDGLYNDLVKELRLTSADM